ncbi:hypothetical protein BDV38DRAFT_280045 [Aspergillus pseudotamarii]|uniref:Uncharacterized protein n=1 Tax=Aspergillus pseudotamarii TaxID=132259 RepID=A0A5N6T2L3_ASPPS|nr:uncharacterized protein BDV38DRAFT_280045 [Aspergillus pseudotamarii]KAE8140546.1 hypothetical protein BDV38DRAFT_280045 [Aspergillus pseudotamarii]
MPITWTPEADAKLLLGFLEQCKDANFKPDYNKLAAHVGPDVTACAVANHIVRLRKMLAKEARVSAASTPATSPTKSMSTPKGKVKGGGVVKTPTKIAKRKIKRESEMEDGDESDMSVQVVIQVKKEYKNDEEEK